MSEPFIIPLSFKGQIIEVPVKLVRIGYFEQFHVNIENTPLIIEFDEERELRVINPENGTSSYIDKDLLEELITTISKLRS
jgi:hypothetical protein